MNRTLLERLKAWTDMKEKGSFWSHLFIPDGHCVLNQEDAVKFTILMPFKMMSLEWISDDYANITIDDRECVLEADIIPEVFHYVEYEMHRDSNKVTLIPFVEECFIDGEKSLVPFVVPEDLVKAFPEFIDIIRQTMNIEKSEEYSY